MYSTYPEEIQWILSGQSFLQYFLKNENNKILNTNYY